MDDLDHRLIRLLRQDARMTAASLAERLGTSRGTVQNRIERMRASGVMLGFTVRMRGDLEEGGVRAITALEVRSADTASVIAALRRMPDVGRVFATNGRWDLMLHLNTNSLASLDRCLQEIRALRAVGQSETSILLSEHK